ncbi:MAG: hypothetical protein AAGB31_11740 [Bdellovibrio sp.]
MKSWKARIAVIHFLLLSWVLHVLVATFLLFTPDFKEKNPPTLVEFEVRSSQQSKGLPGWPSQKPGVQKDPSSVKAKKALQIISENAGINLRNAGTSVPKGETVFGEGEAPVQGNGAWGEQVDFHQSVELTTFFQRILEKIDRSLDYPEDMAQERIQGDVRVDFYVNRKGQLMGDFHAVKGSPLLSLYVMSSLLVLLKEPLPENLWSDRDENIALSVHVRFETYQFSEVSLRHSASFQSNELNLTRARYVTPLAVEKVNKFFTRYMPPIIPIPGGFYVDVIMLAQYINNIGTPDPDDQRKVRLSFTRERLERAVKKKSVAL